ncbi:PREDICTED: uncharacterized protein LOC109115420 [Nelumbo nucifera]|uniref:Uncharacterized protein LOC109115420 n=1 Tax=Nelumbo nucifera TaxID=4432 RepID=A0A1U8QA52_NELNU|nr:PREDICTED: uncharacterized protein LOC109115420 [Nelumbo nucifera]
MSQPPSFQHPSIPDHVYKLHRSLYGLRQAPRAWFTRLHNFLISHDFIESKVDASLFIHHTSCDITLLLIYIDDIIITGSNSTLIEHFINALASEFSIWDLGPLHFFLGLESQPTSDGIILSQSKYALDLLHRARMADAKPCTTPMAATIKLSTDDSKAYDDPTLYHSTVGALQYLTMTRPDLAFLVNKVAQYMSKPTVNHWAALKCILHYIKHTHTLGLHIRHSCSTQLHGYSDSDWTGCLDD